MSFIKQNIRKSTDIKGFTLMEVLIAVAVLSIIISITVMSLRYITDIIKFLKTPIMEELMNISYMRDSIKSSFFFYIENDKTLDINKKFKLFFYGNKEQLQFITTKPIFNKRGILHIEHLIFENHNLYIKEFPVYHKDVNYKKPVIPTKVNKKILIPNIKNFEFSYFYNNRWTSVIQNKMPTVIKIKYINHKGISREIYIKIETDFYQKEELNKYLHSNF